MADLDPEKDVALDFKRDGNASHPATTLEEKELGRRPSSVHSSAHSSVTADDHHHNNEGPTRPTLSRSTSAERIAVKVPRSKRRGLLGTVTILAEVEEPKDYSRKVKWFITFIVAFAAAAAPLGSAIFFPSLQQVAVDLNTTPTITNLSVALYMLSMSIFPLWWSSFSEILGRRTIYLVSFLIFLLFNILSAISTTISMLVVFRMLSGGAAASVQAVGAGTIADIWESRERGRAMGIFYLGPLCGPLLAPIIGGVLAQRWNWRSTMWFLAIYGFLTFVFIVFALPETLKSRKKVKRESEEQVTEGEGLQLERVSTREKAHKRTKKWLHVMRIVFLDPLKIILFLRFPAVLLTVSYASITFGSLYVLNISIEESFEKSPYNFSTLIVGLLYIPNSVGYLFASVFGGRWMDYIMAREAKKAGRYDEKGKLMYQPEDRMRENAWLGAFMYPAALIWYGWSVEKGVHWIVPMLAGFFFGVGSMLIFAMATTMLTEFMPKRSASGVAVNNFMRNIFSCVGGVVTSPVIHAIGNGWLFTILGVTAFLSSASIWAMRHYGPRWRVTMEAKME